MAAVASSSSAFPMPEDSSGVVSQWKARASRRYQIVLDRMAPYPPQRWVVSAALAAIYGIRMYYLQAFYIVTYGLGIYILNLLIGFLSPQVDPERGEEEEGEGSALPSRDTDEFKPFVRRLPEFKFWYALTKAICVAFVMTFFSIFDIPVFWPILLVYWIALFFLTMKRQIKHMIKYRYVPFSTGKPRYMGKTPIPDKVPDDLKEDSSDHSSLDNHSGAEIESL